MYDNYVFDLYGTLIDIHTNEHLESVWQLMAQVYSAYGADYAPDEMEHIFFEMDLQEREAQKARTGALWPEIQYKKLFVRLLHEAGTTHPTSAPVSPLTDPEALEASPWVSLVANMLRIASRKYIRIFPGVRETLKQLRQAGKRLFILSNAQAVFTRPELEQVGLPPFFDDIFLSSDYGVMKPEPSFLGDLMEKHGLDARRTLMVGDDFHADAGVAIANGTDVAMLNTHGNTAETMQKYKEDTLARLGVRDASRIRLILQEPCLPGLLDTLA